MKIHLYRLLFICSKKYGMLNSKGREIMYFINKTIADSVIDFAAEELKKYLRMMMPECGDIQIVCNDSSNACFKLGLMQDFGLDVSDADPLLDDIIYIDCNEKGGIIAGANPRAVLIAVYEYLRQNGCRWLMPGIDGEYIPMQNIKAVKYTHKPSCRFRSWMGEGAQLQSSILDALDFAPKVGLNGFMVQYFNPRHFYNRYYNHENNRENRELESISENQALQWKRHSEVEMAKRGLQFHDVGHGFNCIPFGIDPKNKPENGDYDSAVTPEQRQYISELGGRRRICINSPYDTHFCMSNPQARSIVADFVKNYAVNHSNVDYLNVWLADGINNQCECSECSKKRPADWYVMLLNEIDEKLTKAGSKTKIVFNAYVDTTWAPLEETIRNEDRFLLQIAPYFRSYAKSLPENRQKTELLPYNRNHNTYPATFEASLDYFDEWRKIWNGNSISAEYHYWRHQCADITGLMQAKVIYDDIQAYIVNGIDGIMACGTQRPFFPNGFSFYTFARTMFDASLSFEEIKEDYYLHAYGENWKQFNGYLEKVYDVLPYEYFSKDLAEARMGGYFDLDRSEKLKTMREVTNEGRALIKANHKYDYRVRTVSLRLLEYHADFCDLIADWMTAKAEGEDEKANELLEKARRESGRREIEFEKYFDLYLYFNEYLNVQKLEAPKEQNQ